MDLNVGGVGVPGAGARNYLRPGCRIGSSLILGQVETTVLVGVALYTILGGMLSVLITDFLQFIVMSIGLIVVTLLILYQIKWSALVQTVQAAHGAGGFNPFVNPAMGWPYVLFFALLALAGMLTWMTAVQRLLAAQDVGVGRRIYTRTSFFFLCRFLLPGIWGIAALTALGWAPLKSLSADDLLHLEPAVQAKIEASAPAYPVVVATSEAEIETLDPQARAYTLTPTEAETVPAAVIDKLNKSSLHAMPSFLSTFVPIGLMGLLIAAMLAAEMSSNSSYMLTWASVIYNDLLAPIHKNLWPEKRGLRWNRAIVALIGLFLLFYGLWYPLKGDLWTYLGVTGTIYLSSISVLLIACCYWPRANRWGAAAAIFFGAVIPVAYLVLEQVPATQGFAKWVGPYFSGIAAYVFAGLGMIVGSYLKPNESDSKAVPS